METLWEGNSLVNRKVLEIFFQVFFIRQMTSPNTNRLPKSLGIFFNKPLRRLIDSADQTNKNKRKSFGDKKFIFIIKLNVVAAISGAKKKLFIERCEGLAGLLFSDENKNSPRGRRKTITKAVRLCLDRSIK